MPKNTVHTGPSIAGLTSAPPTEDEYSDAMERHGTDKWTADDADVQDRWLAERRRQLAAVDPHAAPPEVGAAAAEDAATKASEGPDARGATDARLSEAATSEGRVQTKTDAENADDSDDEESAPSKSTPSKVTKSAPSSSRSSR